MRRVLRKIAYVLSAIFAGLFIAACIIIVTQHT